jgi:mannitol operon repressor
MAKKKTLTERIENSPQVVHQMLTHISTETDRGAILSAAAILDDTLVDLLKAFLLSNASTEKLVTGFEAPLGKFSYRIAAAHALGLLSEEEYRNIETIRAIRNEMAHAWTGVTIREGKLRALAQSLTMVSENIQDAGRDPRQCFNCAFTLLFLNIHVRSRAVAPLKLHKEAGGGI